MIPIVLSFLAYAILGLSAGFLGVAWPSMQAGFGLPLGAVGILLLASTSGGILASYANGRLIPRYGAGIILIVGTLIGSLGQLGMALGQQWWLVVVLGFLAGYGAGVLDSGLNIYMAERSNPRIMNWMHACFGLGATLGPLVVTAVLEAGLSWRYAYGIAAGAKFFLALCFILTYSLWQTKIETSDEAQATQGHGLPKPTLILWLSIAIFFLYSGIEVTAGQWSYSLFTEARGVNIVSAARWVSIYWGVFTIGRLLFGLIANQTNSVFILRACMAGLVVGTLGLIAQVNAISFTGLAFIGFMEAPIFPLLVSDTPRRVGSRLATRAISNQVAAAGLGIAVLPGLAGVLAERWSLEIIGYFLLVAAMVMFMLHEVVLKRITVAGLRKPILD